MNKQFALVGMVLACSLCAGAAQAVEPVKVQETAANLANLKKLLGAKNDVTFTSELPGQAEADSMTACGQTKTGEKFIISCNLQASTATIVAEVAYYDDAGLTQLSDLVVLYQDKFFDEGFGLVSDDGGVPEPAVWAMMLAGFAMVGLRARRGQRIAA